MTYGVGLKMDRGLIFMSDTRTNAGLDNIASFGKMRTWAAEGDRVIVLLSAGNLATAQAVGSLINERKGEFLALSSMFQVARFIGETIKEVIKMNADAPKGGGSFLASFIVGGQIKGEEPRLYYIYPEGNFIESTPDTPYFQIGEHKYGKPILVRAYDAAMTFEDAVKLLLVSFDSTLKSNLSVGLPLDLQTYVGDSYKQGLQKRIDRNDPYYLTISEGWGEALKRAFQSLPAFEG
jgi:putative proteasome-type protease